LTEFSLENIIFHKLTHSASPNKKEANEIYQSFKRFCDPAKACHILLSVAKLIS
jgi:coproporphyrinogen III oxidase